MLNAVTCQGQQVALPAGDYNELYILAAADNDTSGDFIIDGKTYTLGIQDWKGFVGQFYNRVLTPDDRGVVSMEKPFAKRDDIAWFASHRHIAYPSANDAYQYCYLYKYAIPLTGNAGHITLPTNKNIKIMAITLVKGNIDHVRSLQALYDDFSSDKAFKLRQN